MHETIQTPKQEAAEVLRNLPDDSILEDIPKQRDLTPLADPLWLMTPLAQVWRKYRQTSITLIPVCSSRVSASTNCRYG